MHENEDQFILLKTVLWLVVFVFFLWVYFKQLKKDKRTVFSLIGKLTHRNVLIFVGMFLLILIVNYIDIKLNPLVISENQSIINQYERIVPHLTILSNSIFAPTIEEILFRGIFFNLFFQNKTKVNVILCIFFSGVIFSFAHQFTFDFNLLIYCAMGWILASTYWYTGSLSYPIALHALVNIL
ncbi:MULTISPECIES: CPBP family intramembrane glutamic endopeptidase [Enterococcus]|uniref:CPBP family intramembrane glutamic endopeptidase n=1 Tax=Enterococcus TaxID=1350 RepID=UPI00137500F2|nr:MULTISPECIES: CPBP family intramembrane glutamic endopeptidase [Enterococcus]